MYSNLLAEMARTGETRESLAAAVNVTSHTMGRWIAGKGKIPLDAAKVIRNIVAPSKTMDYLFEKESESNDRENL